MKPHLSLPVFVVSPGSGISLKQPPAPFVAPSISEEMPSPYWKSWLHSTNYDSAALTATKNSSGLVKDYATTACFVRISSSSDNYYIWQVNQSDTSIEQTGYILVSNLMISFIHVGIFGV